MQQPHFSVSGFYFKELIISDKENNDLKKGLCLLKEDRNDGKVRHKILIFEVF